MQFCNRNPNINSISGSSNNNDDGDYNDNDCESDISSMTMTEHGLQRQLQHHSVLSLHNQLFDVVFNAADDIGNNDVCYDNDDDTIANDDVWVVYIVDNIMVAIGLVRRDVQHHHQQRTAANMSNTNYFLFVTITQLLQLENVDYNFSAVCW